jgi:hypothetical protein
MPKTSAELASEQARELAAREAAELAEILKTVPGGAELVQWFDAATNTDYTPNFGDAEIISLHLDRTKPSILRFWTYRNFRDGDRHIIVTFTLEEVTDLKLEGFSHQNVIGGLQLRRVAGKDEYELLLVGCYGLEGTIRARRVKIAFAPGRPDVDRHGNGAAQ